MSTYAALVWTHDASPNYSTIAHPWHLAFIEVDQIHASADDRLGATTECGAHFPEVEIREPGDFLPVFRCVSCRDALAAKVGLR